MSKRIEYGERWSDYYQNWRFPYTEAEARRKHEQRELYTALITEDDGATVAVELCFAFAYCNIYLHDALGRSAMTFTFEPASEGRLFLSDAIRTEFQGTNRLGWRGMGHTYTQDGRRKTMVSVNRQISLIAENEPVDVRSHFEPVPPFGQWERLICCARNHPPE